jgi:hypothetical protein
MARTFLRLAPFLIRVDNVTLAYLIELKHSKNPKLLRYALLLSRFDSKMEYTAGRTHTLANSIATTLQSGRTGSS